MKSVPLGEPIPVAEFAIRDDFPACTLDQFVDIGGFAGVVIKIVNQSLKVKSPEGPVQSFNAIRLKRIYGPSARPVFPESPPESAVVASSVVESVMKKSETEEAPAPRREFVENPDFEAPLRSIGEFVGRADFPRCVYGQHVAIDQFTGVVIEIVKQSLRVRSLEGVTRSFNIPVLLKLHRGS